MYDRTDPVDPSVRATILRNEATHRIFNTAAAGGKCFVVNVSHSAQRDPRTAYSAPIWIGPRRLYPSDHDADWRAWGVRKGFLKYRVIVTPKRPISDTVARVVAPRREEGAY